MSTQARFNSAISRSEIHPRSLVLVVVMVPIVVVMVMARDAANYAINDGLSLVRLFPAPAVFVANRMSLCRCSGHKGDPANDEE